MSIRLLWACVVLVLCLGSAGAVEQHAFGLRVLDSLALDATALQSHPKMRTTEVQYGNRVTLEKFYAVGIYDMLQASIDQLPQDNLHAAAIVCVAGDGRSVTLSMAEVHPSLSQSPARILLGKAAQTQGGEVVLEADVTNEFDDGSIDFGKLSKLTDPLILERVVLPHLVLDKSRAQEIRDAKMQVMTTNDVQPHRWISGITMLYIIMPA